MRCRTYPSTTIGFSIVDGWTGAAGARDECKCGENNFPLQGGYAELLGGACTLSRQAGCPLGVAGLGISFGGQFSIPSGDVVVSVMSYVYAFYPSGDCRVSLVSTVWMFIPGGLKFIGQVTTDDTWTGPYNSPGSLFDALYALLTQALTWPTSCQLYCDEDLGGVGRRRLMLDNWVYPYGPQIVAQITT